MKYRTSLLVATAFVAGVGIAGPGSGMLGRFGIVPSFAQASSDDRTRELSLFGEVLERVQNDYVEHVTTKKLIHNALSGMLAGLDPHSSYMDPKQWHEMQTETRGKFGGLGMEVTEAGGLVKVVAPLDGTPAARAGIKSGDLITAADGKTLMGMTLSEAVDKLRGAPNTKVTLTIKRAGEDKPLQVTMTREIIHMQVAKSHLYKDIGYVRLSMFNDDTDKALREAIDKFRKERGKKLRGIVLDLRNNPGGLLDQAVDVADDFLNKGTIVSTRGRHSGRRPLLDGRLGRHHRRTAGGGADQQRLRVGQRDRHRRAAGQQPGAWCWARAASARARCRRCSRCAATARSG